MKKTLKLTSIYFKETLLGLYGGNNKKSKTRSFLGIIVLFLFIAAIIGYSLYSIASALAMVSLEMNVLILGLLMSLITSLMITLSDSQGTMYRSKDYDILMSLPLKSVSIITAKYFSTYLVTSLYFLVIAVPTFVVYFIFNPITAWGIIFAIVSLIFMPAFSQLISCCLGWVINLISSKMRNVNMIRTFLSVILAVGLSTFISLANNNIFSSIFANGTPLWFNIVFSNIYLLFVAITRVDFLYFLAMIGVCVAFMALGILITSIGYKKTNSSLLTTRTKTNGKQKPLNFKQKSVFNRLLKKETTTFFNSPVYCVNCIIGSLMIIVVTVITLSVYSSLGGFELAAQLMTAIEVFCVAMCAGIAPTTSVSISIEGTKLQNLKCLPVSFKHIALSKIALNLIITLPIIIICGIVFVCVVDAGWLLALLVLLYLIFAVVYQTTLGLLMNLKFPKINWSNETQAVKSGASLLITMFIDMFVSLLPMIIYIVLLTELPYVISTELFLGICTLLNLILAATFIAILAIKGEKLYKKIQV